MRRVKVGRAKKWRSIVVCPLWWTARAEELRKSHQFWARQAAEVQLPADIRSPPMLTSSSVRVANAGVPSVVGLYAQRDAAAAIPAGFAKVCEQMGWPTRQMWKKLSDESKPWFEADNGAYIYRNVEDGQWWIDEPSGSGVYVAESTAPLPPSSGWRLLHGAKSPAPEVTTSTQQ